MCSSDLALPGYGDPVADEAGLIDLPKSFSYRVISTAGQKLEDGYRLPCSFDGMGCFAAPGGKVAIVRNHELLPKERDVGPGKGISHAYDRFTDGEALPGGASTLIYNPATGRVESEYLSLAGTIRNCSGGVTPWRSWLSCEESTTRKGEDGAQRDHGWAFEVPVAQTGLMEPQPIRAMGRFNHEGAVVDPRTGIIYMTEDEKDSLFYRFLPARPGQLQAGGTLQALGFADAPEGSDSRNWKRQDMTSGEMRAARWVTLDGTDNLRFGVRKEGINADPVGRGNSMHSRHVVIHRVRAVRLRFARAEKIQVRPVDHEDGSVTHGCNRSPETRFRSRSYESRGPTMPP